MSGFHRFTLPVVFLSGSSWFAKRAPYGTGKRNDVDSGEKTAGPKGSRPVAARCVTRCFWLLDRCESIALYRFPGGSTHWITNRVVQSKQDRLQCQESASAKNDNAQRTRYPEEGASVRHCHSGWPIPSGNCPSRFRTDCQEGPDTDRGEIGVGFPCSSRATMTKRPTISFSRRGFR